MELIIFCELCDEAVDSINGEECLDELTSHHLPKEYAILWR
jgi:hypothetical protein